MSMILLKRFAERMRDALTRPWAKMRRDGQQELATIADRERQEGAIPSFRATGEADALIGAARRISRDDERMIALLLDQLLQMRLLLGKDLRLLQYTMDAIRKDGELRAEDREDLLKRLAGMAGQIERFLTGVLRQETSIDSISIDARRMLSESSQLRDLYYSCRQLRGPARNVLAQERAIEAAARGGQPVNTELLAKAFTEELALLQSIAHQDILLLQEEQRHVHKSISLLEEITTKHHFPGTLSGPVMTSSRNLLAHLERALQEEVQKQRIDLSAAARA